MRKSLIILPAAIVAAVASAWAVTQAYPLELATGPISELLCEGVFISGLDPERAYRDMLAPIPANKGLGWMVRTHVDRPHRQVTADVAGLFESRAVYRDGLGCLLVHGPEPADAAVKTDLDAQPVPAPLLQEIGGPAVVEPADPTLREALDGAFAEPAAPPYRLTRAVVVIRDGQILAERYAPGYGVETQLRGNSDTKSVINALLGILVRDGRLTLDQPAPVPAWQQPGDPRQAITIEQLMRMTSGLAWDEQLAAVGVDSVTRMQFGERDMAGFAEAMPLEAAPGTRWKYSTGNTMILSQIIRDAVGGRAGDVRGFAERELFAPLGMSHVTLLFDAAGTPLGGSGMLATARDWGRFGLLYLNDGVIGGRRILPEGWVRFSAAPTPDAWVGYGAGFWTNQGPSWGAGNRVRWGMPEDAFYASGMFGQYVVVVPSERLVVVRLGMSTGPYADTPGVSRLVGDVIAALHAPPAHLEAGQ